MKENMKVFYPAILDRAADGSFGITFPDVPGCSSAADTVEEAVRMGEEALTQHFEVLHDEDLEIPEPSDIASLVKRKVAGDALILIPAYQAGRAVRVTITLPEGLLNEMAAKTSNRSGFIAEAVRQKLSEGASYARPRSASIKHPTAKRAAKKAGRHR